MKPRIFDLDGTLLDSTNIWEKIDIEFFEKCGIPLPSDYFDTVSSMSFHEVAAYTIKRFKLKYSVEELMQTWNDMAVFAYGNTIPMKAGAKDYLFELHKKGVRLAIATTLPSKLYEPALRKHGIKHLFEVICGQEEVSCGKSKPDIFLLVAERLGVKPSECVVFEDVLPAVKSAKSIGMAVHAVYDKASAGDWEQIKKIADSAISDFTNMPMPVFHVIAAGEETKLDFVPDANDFVAAVDGGYEFAKAANKRIDLIIGDMDSIVELPAHDNIVKLNCDKDETDTLAAIKYGIEKGYENFHLYCAMGNRFDHSFANIQCLDYLARKGLCGMVFSDNQIITVIHNSSLEVERENRKIISILALSENATVTLKGLKYCLTEEKLTNTFPIGVSNEFKHEKAEIIVQNGSLLIVYDK